MKFMKKAVSVLIAFIICLLFIACSKNRSPTEVVEDFFEAFEQADYESMKIFSTRECIDIYYREGYVFGMVWAKATKVHEVQNINSKKVRVFVDVEMETAEISALYPDTETSFYLMLKKQSDNTWLIDEFVTG